MHFKYPLYSKDLARSNFPLFGRKKQWLERWKFRTDEKLNLKVNEIRNDLVEEFFEEGVVKLVPR